MREQVLHALPVDLHEFQVNVLPLQQVLGQYPHAGTDFQYVHCRFLHAAFGLGRNDRRIVISSGAGGGVEKSKRIDNRLRDALVGEKMLAEGLFGAYFHEIAVYSAKITNFFN